MSDTERRYDQIKKEMFAIPFACKKFKNFIFGNPFTIETDHQPLVSILNKPMHAALTRLERLMMELQRYDIKLIYKHIKDVYLAITLSQSPRGSCEKYMSGRWLCGYDGVLPSIRVF